LLISNPCTLYAIYGKKTNTGTDAYLTLLDDTSSDDTAADGRASLAFPLAGATTDNAGEAFVFWPDGIPFAVGVWAASFTVQSGTTESTAGDAPNGFIIVG
jgi:hypothetical protein